MSGATSQERAQRPHAATVPPEAGAAATGLAAEAEELLKAGAVLPPGAEGGDRAVPLTARAYRHPGLDGRVVVRLVADELGAAEDLAAGFLGLEPQGEPVVVGLGARRSLGFPEWVLVHHPGDGHHALAVVPELERAARQAKTKPKAALEAYQALAARLAAAVPHFLPTFYEQAGRVFLTVENATYAAQMFSAARRAETEHGLAVDDDRLDAVFLEFALAGALPVKVLSAYAKELAARTGAEEALRRYVRLCLRRSAGGLPPSAQMATDLRRLARAAGADADAVEEAHLDELLGLPATLRAPAAWWKAHTPAVVRLAHRDPAVRGRLLDIMPRFSGKEFPGVWLDLLGACGALAGLGGEAAEEERPADGTSGWLERFLTARDSAPGVPPALPALYSLVERLAGRLRAELAGRGHALTVKYDVDLLDLLLALGIPVADPGERTFLWLEEWAEGEERRDLLALAADPRFRPAFHRAAYRFSDDTDGHRALRHLAASPGGRPMLAEWVREVARASSAAGLPGLPGALRRLGWLPGEALVLAEDAVRDAARADLAPVLARTLRAGLFDELGWPDWEDAAATLIAGKDVDDLVVADAWPYLIVAGPAQARVIGPEGVVLTHDLRIPADDAWGDPSFHYVDGELLVYWRSSRRDGGLLGYWHTSADRPQPLEGAPRGTRMGWYRANEPATLPLPGGGRTTGTGVLHPGDTAIPDERPLVSDGVTSWLWSWDGHGGAAPGWYEYDPAGGALGRRSEPAFLAEALRDVPAGSDFHSGWMLPAPTAEATPAAVPANGLLGWRVVRLPDGSLRGEDLAGRVMTLGNDTAPPVHALTFPGDDRPRAVLHGSYRVHLADTDGVVTSEARTDDTPGTFAAGTLILPPLRFWHFLRPRDPRGSAALRHVGHDTAAALLKAAADAPGDEALHAQVRALFPEVGDEALVAGIAGVARLAAGQRAALDAVAVRLAEALTGEHHHDQAGPADRTLAEALDGLVGGYSRYGGDTDGAFRQLQTLRRAAAGPAGGPGEEPVADAAGQPRTAAADGMTSGSAAGGAVGAADGVASGGAAGTAGGAAGLHLDGPPLPNSTVDWASLLDQCAALAFRAASEFTEPPHRQALAEILGLIDTLGLADAEPARWRRFLLHLDVRHLDPRRAAHRTPAWRGVLPLDDGAFIAFVDTWASDNGGSDFAALFHDPAGRFEVPQPYVVRSSSPVGEGREAGWLSASLGELAARGPAPWRPEAAEEFARLTGVSATLARLVTAGLPNIGGYEQNFLPKAARATLGLKVAEAAIAKDELRQLDVGLRRALVAALLPADPARLWTDGPDVAAAATLWNDKVGRRVAVPEWLRAEAASAVKPGWVPSRALPALLDPQSDPELGTDLVWAVRGDRVRPVDEDATGFTSGTLVAAVAMAAWLAHRLPAGHALRSALPVALATIRRRLDNPGLMLDLGPYVSLSEFRKVAGAPTEVGEGFERYGAVIMATYDDRPAPGVRTALLDAAGHDPYLPALRAVHGTDEPFPAELALRVARDARFEALLADPGAPLAGRRDADGTWWPQDPTRSVPELVGEAAKEHGLGEDAAALYLTLLAMPDPTDRAVARWTGWRPARLKAARAELAATDLVVQAARTRAGRSLFLPGGWVDLKAPRLPLEQWKLPLFDLVAGQSAPLGVILPAEPAAALYHRAWQRVRDGDGPRFEELRTKRPRRR
ncbi:DNA-binding protein [Sphaerisporangium fuscum]|uniref:DNA-binding protein n=1 Tax=Sphaerisporangium fuscum TaxID=2835868 RepID=UPI0027E23B66|nr:DNA-binding protein [Sphaerisporangium fuscum]